MKKALLLYLMLVTNIIGMFFIHGTLQILVGTVAIFVNLHWIEEASQEPLSDKQREKLRLAQLHLSEAIAARKPPEPIRQMRKPAFYEEKHEIHWCYNCTKETKQKLWSNRPNAILERECLNCKEDPYRSMVW